MTPLAVLLGTIVLGLTLGRVKLLGISFGTSAILFVALLAGHFGLEVPDGFGTLGLALFVYTVGISAGAAFFQCRGTGIGSMAVLGASEQALSRQATTTAPTNVLGRWRPTDKREQLSFW